MNDEQWQEKKRELLSQDFSIDREMMLVGGDVHLLEKYAGLLPDNSTIVEIGTYLGWSAVLLAKASPNSAHVWTMDAGVGPQIIHWLGEKIDDVEIAYKSVTDYTFNLAGVQDKVTFLYGSSHPSTELHLAEWAKRPIDLLFVDGDHSYDGAMADLIAWAPMVREGGYMLCHDHNWEEVAKAVRDFIKARPKWHELERKGLTIALQKGRVSGDKGSDDRVGRLRSILSG